MNMTKKKTALLAIMVGSLVCVVFAESSWHIISNIFKGKTEVAQAELLNIYPDPSTPFPNVTITGQPFNITIDVENPNPVTINSWIMVNFTKTGITLNDIAIYSSALYKSYLLWISKEGVYGNTLVVTIKVNAYPLETYFNFQPGLNDNVTYFTVQYNTEGTYDWSLAVYQ
jgi:hypothetical protein